MGKESDLAELRSILQCSTAPLLLDSGEFEVGPDYKTIVGSDRITP